MTLNLDEYFFNNGIPRHFVIPNYQRGYKWSLKEKSEKSQVENLIEDLLGAYEDSKVNPKKEYFIQGVTIKEENGKCILIDGQQRTTTFFFLIWYLDINTAKKIELDYEIRKDSKEFINNMKSENFSLSEMNKYQEDHPHQDIYFFIESIKHIKEAFPDNIDKQDFLNNFLLPKVKLLYILDKIGAVKTFTMMNGNKASMLKEELIKAEILRMISLNENSDGVNKKEEWDSIIIRNRFAREWDKWLYWWNKSQVISFYKAYNTPSMGLLLEYYYSENKKDTTEYSFENFRNLIKTKKASKKVFKDLRDLQKSFEDIFNNPLIHNYFALALLEATNKEQRFSTIRYFKQYFHDLERLSNFAKYRLIGATCLEIEKMDTEENATDSVRKKCWDVYNKLNEEDVYNNYSDLVFKQLLRLNVDEYNKLNSKKGQFFDFSIWNCKSLEHIYPKSRVFHQDKNAEGKMVWYTGDINSSEISEVEVNTTIKKGNGINRKIFGEGYSEHCIGNLVLLYGNDNSKFGALPFDQKKNIFFNQESDFVFMSRSLLHSISVFAEKEWNVDSIKKNKENFLENYKATYSHVLKD